jgi:hypothetical protein
MTHFSARPRPALLLAALLVLSALSLAPSRADAQIPKEGQVAVGLGGGAAFPFEGSVSTGWDIGAEFDWYLFSKQAGLRGTMAYTSSGTDLAESPSRSMGYLLASAFYEFSHGTLVPYAIGGVGLYVVDPPYGSRTVRVGAHAGAGVAFYFRRRIALTGEVLVHGLGSVEGLTSSFVTTNAAIRYYF